MNLDKHKNLQSNKHYVVAQITKDFHHANLRRFAIDNQITLRNLFFVNKNWPNDARVRCKAPNNVVNLIDSKLNLQ
jgi:DNA topoisomerase VI subunit A